jgi:predicted nucleic acid-binding protein
MQTYTSILDNASFRIALLDTTQKTAVIALKYNISASHARALRMRYGRPHMDAKNYDSVVSRRWQDDKALVHDVRTLRAQEVVAKHGYGLSSVVEMRRQLGVTKRQILRSRQFKNAVKTLPLAEVARLFRLGISVVSKYRVRFGVAKTKGNALRYNPTFMTAVHGDGLARDIADDYGCTAAYVQLLRREAK